jgi:hypothetical protein
MDKNKLEELITEYLNKDGSPQQKEELKAILKQNGYDLNELSELETIYNQLDDLQVPEPSEEMDDHFYTMLEKTKQEVQKKEQRTKNLAVFFQSFFPKKYLPQIAYSLLLLLIGWTAGSFITPKSKYESQLITMTSEMKQMRQMMMLTLIEQPSASERIKAVNLTNEFDDVNDTIIDAMFKTLNNDPNENVRLVTVEALFEFANNPKVRQGLIQSINKQSSPLVQLALADIMITLQEKNSVEEFNKLLLKKDLNDSVRNRIEKTVNILM